MLEAKEADVHDAGNQHHQQGAEGAELRAALDHLRDAHLRALRRVQRHQHAADQMADENRDDAPEQIQVEQLHAQRAGDDGQRRDVAAEPEREQIPDLSVAIFGGHVSYRVFFNERCGGCCRGSHDELQGKDEYVDVLRQAPAAGGAFLVGAIMCKASG
jgi:hypothetical protein